MNVTYHNWRTPEPVTVSVAEYVTSEIKASRDYYSSGIAEEANSKANRCAEAIGKLCDVLAAKGLLDMSNLSAIAGAYHGTDTEPPQLTR